MMLCVTNYQRDLKNKTITVKTKQLTNSMRGEYG